MFATRKCSHSRKLRVFANMYAANQSRRLKMCDRNCFSEYEYVRKQHNTLIGNHIWHAKLTSYTVCGKVMSVPSLNLSIR